MLQTSHTSNGSAPKDTSKDFEQEADKVMKKLNEIADKQKALENQLMMLTCGRIGVLVINILLLLLMLLFNSCPNLPVTLGVKISSFFGC